MALFSIFLVNTKILLCCKKCHERIIFPYCLHDAVSYGQRRVRYGDGGTISGGVCAQQLCHFGSRREDSEAVCAKLNRFLPPNHDEQWEYVLTQGRVDVNIVLE